MFFSFLPLCRFAAYVRTLEKGAALTHAAPTPTNGMGDLKAGELLSMLVKFVCAEVPGVGR